MLKKLLGISAVVLVGVLVASTVTALAMPSVAEAAYGPRQGQGQGAGIMEQSPGWGYAEPGSLSAEEVEALQMALDDEYKAWSVYDQVIADFGPIWPFASIQQAEENHIAALIRLFDRYGLEVPQNSWPGNVPAYETVAEACAAGVQAEIDNADLYAQIFQNVDNPDIVQVFTNLQQASLTKHLPAFEQCAGQEPIPAVQSESYLPSISQ